MRKFIEIYSRYVDEQILIIIAVFLFLVATNVQAGWLYFVISFIAGMLAFSAIVTMLNLRKLRIKRTFPNIVNEDELVSVALKVYNDSKLPKFFVLVEDSFPALFPDEKNPRLFFLYIPGKGSAESAYIRKAYKRGIYNFGALNAESAGMTGFCFWQKKISSKEERLTVLPGTFSIPKHFCENASDFKSEGEKTFKMTGLSYDFAGICEYMPGKETRFIHWPSTAKQSRLMIKEFNSTAAASQAVVIDLEKGTEIGSGRDTTTEHIIRFAATILKESSQKRRRFDMYICNDGKFIEDRNLSYRNGRMKLAALKPESSTGIEHILGNVAQGMKRREKLYIFKVLPFTNLELFDELNAKQISTTVVFFAPNSFISADEKVNPPVRKEDYDRQIEELRKIKIQAHLYSPLNERN